jgi:hypothetical protein
MVLLCACTTCIPMKIINARKSVNFLIIEVLVNK